MCVLVETYFLYRTEWAQISQVGVQFRKNLLYLKEGEKEPFLLLKLLGADPKNQNSGKSFLHKEVKYLWTL